MTQPSPQDEMRAYDQLPVTLRRALGKAGDQFSATQLLAAWKAKRYTCRELVEMIQEQDTAPALTPSPAKGISQRLAKPRSASPGSSQEGRG